MPNADAFSLQRSGLNEFLFASIGTEPSGMALSVLSVFGRLGKDPWNLVSSGFADDGAGFFSCHCITQAALGRSERYSVRGHR